ncbi:probable peroxisomal acyl-coenzyme A oxidase 1 [Drosophila novamexicana]|uniref:probable peroxisomal acyl-coenzyme A oxidase 1 n=1 Tax=Drosophila novamexicana TaxID=47314 RepID=UPI0011E59AD8|nr:probable peroxisomal acyl-coenzyme A oxidase 1 [Drosophila novamexicana]
MSQIKNLIPTTVNPDLQKERSAATFNVDEFAAWWQGGADKLKTKRVIEQAVFSDLEDGYGINHEYMSHEDLYNSTVKKVAEAAPKLKALQEKLNPGGKDIWPGCLYSVHAHGLFPANHPLATHITMFVDVIKGQGTPEQVEKWGSLAENCNIIGTYAQTELAHGTNVRGIETRADYDPRAGEFVLNTPNLEAYKWWPGGMGHTANHAMVVAQLYIAGKHKGVQMFIVPLRDPETHMPLPGIDIGEIGKKLGMAAVNQGFLGLKNVRIPRTNMLMKYAKVDRDGTFTASPASKVTYLTMVFTRCLIVNLNSTLLLQAATIATRYSAVRRQSPIEPDQPEPQIIDHVTQRLKLFPEIATGMAYHLAAEHMWELYDQTVLDANNGKFDRLPDMHILSCALKVLCTTDGCAGIERLRLSTGGHGYHIAANLSNIYGNAVAAYTYEGENTVLLLQIGRALVKAWASYKQGQTPSSSYAYFESSMRLKQFPKWTGSWQCIVQALQYTAAHKTRIAFENLSERIAAGQSQAVATNNTGIELTRAAELHGRQFVCETFIAQITGPKAQKRSPALNKVLENVVELFLVQTVLNNLSEILRFVNLTDEDLRSLQKRLELSLEKFRPDAVAICDGFDFHDRVLNSVLGSYDGNVYPRLFDAAKRSTMNQKPVQKSFETYLKPLMKANL